MKVLLTSLICLAMMFSAPVFAKEKPFPVRLLLDNFEDGDYTNNPEWTVARGTFSVEGGALVSRVGVATPVEVDDSVFEADSWEQLTDSSTDVATDVSTPALIYTSTQLSNAFSIRLDHQFVGGKGKMVLGVYQLKRGKLGYRVVVNPKGVVRLIRLGETQGRVVVAKAKLGLKGDVTRKIVWTRHDGGRHVVRIDGEKYIDVVDPYFKQPFDGFFILNRAGEQRIDRVAVRGTN